MGDRIKSTTLDWTALLVGVVGSLGGIAMSAWFLIASSHGGGGDPVVDFSEAELKTYCYRDAGLLLRRTPGLPTWSPDSQGIRSSAHRCGRAQHCSSRVWNRSLAFRRVAASPLRILGPCRRCPPNSAPRSGGSYLLTSLVGMSPLHAEPAQSLAAFECPPQLGGPTAERAIQNALRTASLPASFPFSVDKSAMRLRWHFLDNEFRSMTSIVEGAGAWRIEAV